MYHGRICWVSSKLITRVISLVSSLLETTTSAIKFRETLTGWKGVGCCIFQQKTCNICETGQYMTMHGYYWWLIGSCIRTFDWHRNQMTSDDLERPFRTLFQNTCVFGDHHENVNEDRPILSAAKMYSAMTAVSDKLYADIREGSLKTRRQTTVG